MTIGGDYYSFSARVALLRDSHNEYNKSLDKEMCAPRNTYADKYVRRQIRTLANTYAGKYVRLQIRTPANTFAEKVDKDCGR